MAMVFMGTMDLGIQKAVLGNIFQYCPKQTINGDLSDPSYTKQIITFTFPHMDIVVTNQEDSGIKKNLC